MGKGLFWEPVEGEGVADGIGVGEDCVVTSVVLEGRSDVVSFAAMGGEGSALRRSFEGEDFSSGDDLLRLTRLI